MGNEWEDTSKKFLSEIKAALQAAQQQLEQERLKITKLELKLKSAVEKKADGTLKFKIIELGADISKVNVLTLAISLKPTPAMTDLAAAGISEELAEGIAATVAVAREAAEMQPSFDLDESALAIEVGMTKTGTAKIFVGGSIAKETSQTATFTLKKV